MEEGETIDVEVMLTGSPFDYCGLDEDYMTLATNAFIVVEEKITAATERSCGTEDRLVSQVALGSSVDNTALEC